ncbi:MAG: ribonuclease P protein component [Bacteroidales bacterium]|nr:ribonuclease P protein component [Bacteroidales bacterium]
MKFAEKLYKSGVSLVSFPYKILSADAAEGEEPRVIISVPKKMFKRAVKRNYIRRRIRESLRLSKGEFPVLEHRHLLIIYISTKLCDFHQIDNSLKEALGKL